MQAILTRLPTPWRSIVWNGDASKIPCSRYWEKKAPSTSSREKPHVVCVRSFVPKEKNSASSAMCAAVSAARGSSIIVPTVAPSSTPARAASSASTPEVSSATRRSSRTEPISGIMICGAHLEPRRRTSAAAWAMARTCIPNRPLHGDAQPHAAQPEHRVLLVQPAHRREQLLVLVDVLAVVVLEGDLDREIGEVRQELVQRRVEQPDRDGLAGHPR